MTVLFNLSKIRLLDGRLLIVRRCEMNQTPRLFLLVQLMVCVIGAIGCGGDESKNECEEEYEIRMSAIQSKCSEPNLAGCCYCSCELTGAPTTGCTCQDWTLTSAMQVEQCQGGALNNAVNCTSNPASCAEQTKNGVFLRCN